MQRNLKLRDALTGALQPLAALRARLYLGQGFFLLGLTKVRDLKTTVALFTDEYHVLLLSSQLAAALGTAGKLGLAVLLALGLGGRLSALGSRWPFSVLGRGHLPAVCHPGGTRNINKKDL